MEKAPGADDLKGLEEEIDSAVDRLFVEEKEGLVESIAGEVLPRGAASGA